MLCEGALRHLGRDPLKGDAKQIALGLTWMDCRRRAFKKTLPDGTTIRFVLRPGNYLAHGDVVYDDGQIVIAIELESCALITAESADTKTIAEIAYGLGNLHVPIQIVSNAVFTPPDGPSEAVFRQFGLSPTTVMRRFHPAPMPNGVAIKVSDAFVIRRVGEAAV